MSIRLKVNSMIKEKTGKPETMYIYTLFLNGTPVYVGQTCNVNKRAYTHMLEGKEFDEIEYVQCCTEQATEKEIDEIIKRQPTLNKALPSNDRYLSITSLTKQVSETIKENKHLLNIVFKGRNNRKSARHEYVEIKVLENIKNAILSEFIKLGEE